MATMASNRSTAEAEIRSLTNYLVQGMRDKDARGVMSCFAPGSVMFSLAPPLRFTADDRPGDNALQDWFDTWDGPLGYEVRDQQIFTEGDLAFAHSLNRLTGRKKTGDQADVWFRETLGLRREGGQWKIIHQHESVPFYMDGSDRAALDLKP
jgi:ketosteroid isomerase-like protein